VLRTHTCGEPRAALAGKEVTVAGWVHTRRDNGELTFIDLRDRYGITQVVAHAKENPAAHKALGKVRNEWVLRVRGTVRSRPEGTKNAKLPTGEVEIAATEIEVLNESKTPPFYVNEETEVEETLRWKYRYVDLRRERSRDILKLRHEVTNFIRNFFVERGFWEIETTMMIRSDPTGARDFIVPSRYRLRGVQRCDRGRRCGASHRRARQGGRDAQGHRRMDGGRQNERREGPRLIRLRRV